MKRKLIIKIVFIIIIAMLLCTGNVKAVYQSTPQTHANPQSQTWDAWLSGIRTMEATGGAMGLEETLNGTDATSSSNNIDVHMMKATEYGAIALLSASPYGNPNNTQKPETSTGDTKAQGANGVFYNYDNWEFTACIAAEEVGNSFNKYWDKYNTLNLQGLSPSETWHGGSAGSRLDNTGIYTPDRTSRNGSITNYLISSSLAKNCGLRTVLTAGKQGIFAYSWATRKSGYTRGSYMNDGTYIAYTSPHFNYSGISFGTYYSPSSFYARCAAVNMEGI